MSLEYMSGVSAIGRRSKAERKKKREERKAKRKERRAKAGSRVAKIGLAPARAAFLKAVQFNALKLAEKLARIWKKDSTKLIDFWKKFGGNPDMLKSSIEKGIKAKLSGIGSVTLAAGLSAALPIVLKVLELLKNMGLSNKDEEAEDDQAINEAKTNLELDDTFEKDNVDLPTKGGKTEDTALLVPGAGSKTEDVNTTEDTGTGNLKRNLLIAGGVVAAAGIIYAIVKSKPRNPQL